MTNEITKGKAARVGIVHDSDFLLVGIPSGEAISDVIDMRHYDKLIIHMPSGWTAASIGFQVSHNKNGGFQPLYDATPALVAITTPAVGNSYVAPSGLAGARYVKLWSETGGADVNQVANRQFYITLKA